jgi:hypothetical protein
MGFSLFHHTGRTGGAVQLDAIATVARVL